MVTTELYDTIMQTKNSNYINFNNKRYQQIDNSQPNITATTSIILSIDNMKKYEDDEYFDDDDIDTIDEYNIIQAAKLNNNNNQELNNLNKQTIKPKKIKEHCQNGKAALKRLLKL